MVQSDEGKQTLETLWSTFEQEYVPDNSQMFKDGGKLEYLIGLHKKGAKMCKCGCALHKVMEKGGMIEKCACGCKSKKVIKADNGVKVSEKQTDGTIIVGNSKTPSGHRIYRKMYDDREVLLVPGSGGFTTPSQTVFNNNPQDTI